MKWFLRPYNIFLITTIASFFAWLLPSFDGSLRKGFFKYYSPDADGIIFCAAWIVNVYASSLIAYLTFSRMKLNSTTLDARLSISSGFLLYTLVTISFIGVSYVVYGLYISIGFAGMIDAFVGGRANELKEALYSDYQVGLPSLRYTAILAAAVGLFHLFTDRKFLYLSFFSIVMLLIVAAISSRLSIIYAIFIFLGLIYSRLSISIKIKHLLIGFLVVIHLIFVLNYSRNINFYRSIGINNFYLAGISEIVTYVGSPFQGFLSAGDLRDRFLGKSEIETHSLTGISEELSTNSSLLELTRKYGFLFANIIISFCAYFGGMIIAIGVANKNNILALCVGIIGYCFAEIWRVFLFGQGIVFTLLGIIVGFAVFIIVASKIKTRRRWNEKNTI